MTLAQLVNQFHFLRPEWLLAILPAVIICGYFWQRKSSTAHWRNAINPQLLEHLIDSHSARSSRWPWLVLLIAWLICAIALAGPAWNKLPQPVHQRQDALVIVMDLSLSMLAEDIKPSRLIRARHKVLDILNQRQEGQTALVAYSGDAHIVSPLTDDNTTIANLTPALAPDMMPVAGSDPVAAMKLAKQLFSNAGINNGRILLVTDGITDNDLADIDDDLKNNGLALSILGVGSLDGAPIPRPDGFFKDQNGSIIVPQLIREPLQQLAKRNNGRYTDVSLGDQDIQFLLPVVNTQLSDNSILTEREFDQWQDRGALLTLLLLPLSLLAFRRGWLLPALPLLLVLEPQTSYAFEWQDLWQRSDQQAIEYLQQGDAKKAAEKFKDPHWKGIANYRDGDYSSAAKNFALGSDDSPDADALYNRGNALAKAGQLDEAIESYQQALVQQPAMEDAQFNLDLIKQLKQQQQQEQQQGSDQQEQQSDQGKEQNKQQDKQQQGDQQGEGEPGDQQQNTEGSGQQDEQQNSKPAQEQEQEQRSETDAANSEDQQERQQNQQQAQQDEQQQTENAEQSQLQPSKIDPQTEQQKQAMEQWLRQIPDDPSGLLRRKFNYEHRLRQQQSETQREQPQW